MRMRVRLIGWRWFSAVVLAAFIASLAGAMIAPSAMRLFGMNAAQSLSTEKSAPPPQAAGSGSVLGASVPSPQVAGSGAAPPSPVPLAQTAGSGSAPAVSAPLPQAAGNGSVPPASAPSAQATGGGSVTMPGAVPSVTPKGSGKESDDKAPSFWTAVSAIFASLAWPVATYILIRMVLKTPQLEILLNYLYRRTSQISILGLEIKLSEGAKATLDDVRTLISKVPESHQVWVHNTHLLEQLRNVTSDIRGFLLTKPPNYPAALASQGEVNQLRFTLHVPDIVFTHSLRQLVDYMGCGRGGAGRLFSARRGIIGLAWRKQESRESDKIFDEDQLVENWGMTRLEARDTTGGKNLLWAFVLKDKEGVPIGLLYVDGKVTGSDGLPSDFFSNSRIGSATRTSAFAELDKMVQASASDRGLIKSLKRLDNARIKVTQIDIFAR